MKTPAMLLCCCLLSLAAFSRSENAEAPRKANPNYLEYYRAVAAAEEAVVQEGYTSALTQYRSAFEAYPYNNPIDCYVAAQVAAYVDDKASCTDFLYRGLSFGLPAQTIAGNPHLRALFQTMPSQTVDSCWNVYQQRIDHEARAKMISLIRYDQSIIQSLGRNEKFYDHSATTTRLTPRYQPVWDSLMREVSALIRSNGFPAQKVIGTQNGDDSLFIPGPHSAFVTYLFIHHCNAWPLVSDVMWDELLKGNVTPKMYGVIYESSNGRRIHQNSINYFAARTCEERACRSIVKHHLREIDEARWAIGLEKYGVMEKMFVSRSHYYKWCKNGAAEKKPYFDFQCDLSFQHN